MIKFLISASLILSGMQCAIAQHSIKIQVRDQSSRALIPNATITLGSVQGKTDNQGTLVLSQVKSGAFLIQASHVGYLPTEQQIQIQKSQDFQLFLSPQHLRTDEAFVSATRAANYAATSFKNLDKKEIAKNNLGQDIPYLLDQTPSVVISSDAGAGIGYTNMSIRGSDATRINVTLNGIPLNNAESMGAFFVNLPDFASSLESIQVQRGVGTSTNGAGAFGGSLNLQTDKVAENAYAELNNSFGSYNSWKNTLKVGTGLMENKFAINARLSKISSDGYIDRATSDLKSFYVDAGYYGKNQILKATIFSGKEKTYQAWNGVPEDKLADDRTYNEFTYANQTDNYTQTHYHLHYNNTLSEKWDLNAALHYTKGAGYYEEYKLNEKFSKYGLDNVIIGQDTLKNTDLIRRRWLDNDFYGATYAINYRAQSNLKFTLGGAFNQYKGDHFGEVIWAKYASNSFPTEKYYFNNARKDDFNTYLKADYTQERYAIYADVQYRYIDYRFEGLNRELIKTDQQVHHSFLNPKIGFTYFINERSNWYLSYALAHKEPSRNDYTESIFTERPKAEKLHDYEAGYRYRSNTLTIGANGYAMLYTNQLILTGKLNGVGERLKQNIPDSYRIGLELDGAWVITPKFTWKATAAISQNKIKNYTDYVDVYNTDNEQVAIHYGTTNIVLSANTILSNSFTYLIVPNFDVSLLSKYVSRQYLDNTSTQSRSIDPYFVSNLRFNYQLKALGLKAIDINLAINNIFNEKYVSSGSTWGYINADQSRTSFNSYYPQATTNFMLGLNLSF